MKNRIRIKSVLTLVAIMLTAAVLSAVAVTAAYDPSSDAVVMVSGLLKFTEETIKPTINTTVAEQIKPVQTELAAVNERLAATETKLAESEKKLAELEEKLAQDSPAVPAVSASWEVIYLTTGQTLLATSPCAIILRAGSAAVVSPFNGQDGSSPQGLSDLTAGADILADTPLSANHHILIPRGNDGRGIRITSEGGAYIMVQGGYTVVE